MRASTIRATTASLTECRLAVTFALCMDFASAAWARDASSNEQRYAHETAARDPVNRRLRFFGRVLAALGLAVGIALGLTFLFPIHLVGIAWLAAAGLAKFTLAASFALIGAGAAMQRMANRADERSQLPPPAS